MRKKRMALKTQVKNVAAAAPERHAAAILLRHLVRSTHHDKD
jgi:hypothetical protein